MKATRPVIREILKEKEGGEKRTASSTRSRSSPRTGVGRGEMRLTNEPRVFRNGQKKKKKTSTGLLETTCKETTKRGIDKVLMPESRDEGGRNR